MASNGPPRIGHPGREAAALLLLLLLFAGACVLRLMVGQDVPSLRDTIMALREDRMLAAAAVGAALSVSGVLLQAMLRNPLASPYLLGVSSGAAVGVLASRAGYLAFVGVWLAGWGHEGISEAGAALLAAWLMLAIVYMLSQRRGRIDPLGMVLVGVVMTAIASAAIMFIHYFHPQTHAFEWLMGYLDEDNLGKGVVTLDPAAWGAAGERLPEGPYEITVLHTVCGVVVFGLLCALALGRSMDVATLSDSESYSVGLAVSRLRLVLFLLAGLMTSVTVLIAGPIGFVGLIGPHLARLLIGPRHRPLVLGAALAGAMLVIGADAAAKVISLRYPNVGILPLGAIMAVVGGPVFVLLLRPQLGRGVDG